MEYYNYPKDKIEIFEASDKNYFFKGKDFSYLCSFDEIKKVDMRNEFSGYVLVVYKRYAVVKNGLIVYKNEQFCDGHIAKGRYKESGYVIISDMPKEYQIQSWGGSLRSHELRDDSKYNQALNPIIFENAELALQKAIELSGETEEVFVVAQWFDEFDRH